MIIVFECLYTRKGHYAPGKWICLVVTPIYALSRTISANRLIINLIGGVSFTKHDASARAQAITQLLYVTSFVFTLLTSPRIIETTKLRNLPYIAKSCGRILSYQHFTSSLRRGVLTLHSFICIAYGNNFTLKTIANSTSLNKKF